MNVDLVVAYVRFGQCEQEIRTNCLFWSEMNAGNQRRFRAEIERRLSGSSAITPTRMMTMMNKTVRERKAKEEEEEEEKEEKEEEEKRGGAR